MQLLVEHVPPGVNAGGVIIAGVVIAAGIADGVVQTQFPFTS